MQIPGACPWHGETELRTPDFVLWIRFTVTRRAGDVNPRLRYARPQGAWHLQRKSQRFYWYPHHLVRHRGHSPRAQRQACTGGRWLDVRIVTIRRVPGNRNDCAVGGDSPRSRRHHENEVGQWPTNWARYRLKVHGTCSENPRDFISMRIIWCNTGDTPRGHSGRRVPAAAGWTLESSQSEESPETATTAPLPGTVPAVADTTKMRWGSGRQTGLVTALRCMAPAAWHLQRPAATAEVQARVASDAAGTNRGRAVRTSPARRQQEMARRPQRRICRI